MWSMKGHQLLSKGRHEFSNISKQSTPFNFSDMPIQSTQPGSSSFDAFPRLQMPLSKTLSCPRPGAPSPQTQVTALHAASVDLSDNDRTIHRQSPHVTSPSACHNEPAFIHHLREHSDDNPSSDFESMDFY